MKNKSHRHQHGRRAQRAQVLHDEQVVVGLVSSFLLLLFTFFFEVCVLLHDGVWLHDEQIVVGLVSLFLSWNGAF